MIASGRSHAAPPPDVAVGVQVSGSPVVVRTAGLLFVHLRQLKSFDQTRPTGRLIQSVVDT